MAIRSDKNIEALRLGIAEQERERISRENIERNMELFRQRETLYRQPVRLIPAIALKVGDRLAATDNGTSFYVAGTVVRFDTTTERGNKPAGDWWVSVQTGGGIGGSPSYGHAFDSNHQILVVDDVPVAVRKALIAEREEARFPRAAGATVRFEAPIQATAA